MINVIALAALGEELNFSDRLSMAGTVTLQGMLTIFVVLAILWGTIEIMHRLLHRKKTPKKLQHEEQAPASVQTEAPSIATVPLTSSDNGELVAVITAAISAMLAEEGHTGGFRVVSFRRRESANKRNI